MSLASGRTYPTCCFSLGRDADESGTVSKVEFRRALPALGVEANTTAMDTLFDSLDPDGNGEINYNELNTLLRPKAAENFFGLEEQTQAAKPVKDTPPVDEATAALQAEDVESAQQSLREWLAKHLSVSIFGSNW